MMERDMQHYRNSCWIAALAFACTLPSGAQQDKNRQAEETAIFQKHILPILIGKCASCHGTSQKLSDLSLASRNAVLQGGKRGPAIVPGNAAKSLLVSALEQTGDLKMPPGSKLPEETVAAFRRWIELGAPWEES